MEINTKYILLLSAYNLIFFRKFWLNPNLNSTGEMISTFFPQMLWQGRQWRQGKIPLRDNIYYYEPASIPFLSTFYPPQVILSYIVSGISLNIAFKLYQYFLLIHYFIGSILSYCLFIKFSSPEVALFGAISLTYMGSAIKIGHPCTVYTICWIPGAFLCGWIGQISLGMATLGGYWPILVYFMPLITVYSPLSLVGLMIASPQLLLFSNYYPRSIRSGKEKTTDGKVPWWKLLDLLWGDKIQCKINNVFAWEMALYCGICPLLLIYTKSTMVIVLIITILIAVGILPCLFRIPARVLHLMGFSIVWCSVNALGNLKLDPLNMMVLIIVQGWLLLKNIDQYPWHPFAEPIKSPEDHLMGEYNIKKFPFFTGYYKDTVTKGYTGGFSFKETCERNGVTNPNGERL